MALLDKWIALDIGAYLARFYDFSTQKEIVLKTIIAQKGSEILGVSDQAIAYLYKDLDTIQIQYPISHGQILHSIEPLIHEGLDKLHAFDGLLRPSVLVSVPSELSQRQRELWQQAFLNCGVRKVEFISNLEVLQEENPCFLVHSGHSYTEIHICAYDKVLVSKTIYYAGAQVDEQIQRIVYMKTGYFITKVDAAHLKEMASDAFWQQKNTLLMCYGFDSRQNLHPIQIESSIVWPAIEMVSSQISLWVKHCFDSLPASLQEYLSYGRFIFAWGPEYAWSVDYLKRNAAAYCVVSPDVAASLQLYIDKFDGKELDVFRQNANRLFDQKHEFCQNANRFSQAVVRVVDGFRR